PLLVRWSPSLGLPPLPAKSDMNLRGTSARRTRDPLLAPGLAELPTSPTSPSTSLAGRPRGTRSLVTLWLELWVPSLLLVHRRLFKVGNIAYPAMFKAATNWENRLPFQHGCLCRRFGYGQG